MKTGTTTKLKKIKVASLFSCLTVVAVSSGDAARQASTEVQGYRVVETAAPSDYFENAFSEQAEKLRRILRGDGVQLKVDIGNLGAAAPVFTPFILKKVIGLQKDANLFKWIILTKAAEMVASGDIILDEELVKSIIDSIESIKKYSYFVKIENGHNPQQAGPIEAIAQESHIVADASNVAASLKNSALDLNEKLANDPDTAARAWLLANAAGLNVYGPHENAIGDSVNHATSAQEGIIGAKTFSERFAAELDPKNKNRNASRIVNDLNAKRNELLRNDSGDYRRFHLLFRQKSKQSGQEIFAPSRIASMLYGDWESWIAVGSHLYDVPRPGSAGLCMDTASGLCNAGKYAVADFYKKKYAKESNTFFSGGNAPDYLRTYIQHYYDLVKLGHPSALVQYGRYLEERRGEGSGSDAMENAANKDLADAAKLYKRSATLGDARGQFNYARCLEEGIGVKKDESLAATYYKRAVDQGHFDACYRYGCMLGRGMDPNLQEAAQYLKKVADSCLETGISSDTDPFVANRCMNAVGAYGCLLYKLERAAEAARYLRFAEENFGENNSADTRFYYACCLKDGMGVEMNIPEAAGLFSKINKPKAQYFAGVLYLHPCCDNFVHVNRLSGSTLVSNIAEKYIPAMYVSSHCCMFGIGTVASTSLARKYYDKAERKGNPEAKEMYRAFLESPSARRDIVIKEASKFKAIADSRKSKQKDRSEAALNYAYCLNIGVRAPGDTDSTPEQYYLIASGLGSDYNYVADQYLNLEGVFKLARSLSSEAGADKMSLYKLAADNGSLEAAFEYAGLKANSYPDEARLYYSKIRDAGDPDMVAAAQTALNKLSRTVQRQSPSGVPAQ
ncbi:MAG: sel1 repeat family protein [Holosporales bacterium]|nr:sel1 repeat family protein [Holosporales bacterium]